MTFKTVLKHAIHEVTGFIGQFKRTRVKKQRAKPSRPSAPPRTVPETPPTPVRALPVARPNTAPQQDENVRIVLGTDIRTGEAVTISLKELLQGLYGIGATGTGKTTLDLNMVFSFIRSGLGVCIMDPHGDLNRRVIAAIPEHRLQDVIYLDVMDSTGSFGLNFFECPAGADDTKVGIIASFVMHVFEKVWSVGPETPRLAQVLRNTTRLLIENPGMTFAEIPLLLWEDGVREKLVRRVTNTQTKLFWQQYNRKQSRDREELTASTINKVDAYLNEPLIARIVSQSASTIDFRRIMDEGKILLVNLSPQLEEASRLIGAVIIGRLLMAAFSRIDTPEKDRKPFLIYADEYQRFATSDFATFLAEARKFKIGTTISNQTLEQLDDLNRATALQAGSLVVFRVSGEDAKVLAKSYDTTPTPALVGQEPVRAIVTDPLAHLLHHGHPHPTVVRFVSDILLPFEAFGRNVAAMAPTPAWIDPVNIRETHVRQAREVFRDALATCMREGNADVFLHPFLLFILGASVGDGSHYVLSPHCRKMSFWENYELIGVSSSANYLGEGAFLKNAKAVSTLLSTYGKKRGFSLNAGRTMLLAPGPTFIAMLRLLRQAFEVLSKEPLMTDTGLYQPKYMLRSYQDQENLIANELSTLPNYHAKVRLLSGEHTIKTSPSPPLFSEQEVEARIRAIKDRMISHGYTKAAQAVEEEVAKRHELLRQRPPEEVPPTHTTGRRTSRGKQPPQT